ncbi:hypothetical protein [Micromonospora sp. NPDC049102]|uniref:hypothetical protein n=1 Tax=Micromonospora sp. NPDC049102 TaxID=3364265 RepID=UPI003712B6FF
MTKVTTQLSVSMDGFYAGPQFDGRGDKEAIELTPTRVIHTPQVTHIRYRVNGRAPLVLDDRGSGGGPTTTTTN